MITMHRFVFSAFSLSLLCLLGLPGHSGRGHKPTKDIPGTIEKAQQEGKPILLYYGTSSCKGCIKFSKARETHTALQSALEKVVLITLDCYQFNDHAFFKDCAKFAFPTFKLLNEDLTVKGIWSTADPDVFLESLSSYLNGKSPIEEKLAIYRAAPTAANAMAVGKIYKQSANYEKAHEYFEIAEKHDPGGPAWLEVLFLRELLAVEGKYDLQKIRVEFIEFLDSERPTPSERIYITHRLWFNSLDKASKSFMLPYWKQLEQLDPDQLSKYYRMVYDSQMRIYANTFPPEK